MKRDPPALHSMAITIALMSAGFLRGRVPTMSRRQQIGPGERTVFTLHNQGSRPNKYMPAECRRRGCR